MSDVLFQAARRARYTPNVIQLPVVPLELEPLPPSPPATTPVFTVVPREAPRLETINNIVCDFYELKKTDFISHRRSHYLVRARQVAMYLARVMTSRSYSEIARLLDDRDHTTAMHGHQKIAGQLNHDARLRDEIDLLEIKIRERVANPPKCCPACGVWS